MNGLFLHTSNQLETLVDELAGVVRTALDSPFTPEIVMVQSLGMRRWISLQLASRLGICMQFKFPFPHAFLDSTLRDLVPEMAPEGAFSAELMTWKIHRLLPPLLARPEFEPLRHYVKDGDALKLYQLASRLAHLFDQYLLYRPELLLEWERAVTAPLSRDGDAAWQALLWREVNRESQVHFGAALERLIAGEVEDRSVGVSPAHGRDAHAPVSNQRVSIFGISSLPPAQMRVFFHLAKSRPVHLFLLGPSQEYHGDDLTPKQRARRGLTSLPEELPGNPLLTSLGRLNAHFTEVLLEADERAGHLLVDASETFVAAAGSELLHQIQRDILLARNPSASDLEDEEEDRSGRDAASTVEAASSRSSSGLSPADGSLQIHVCHSPMREVEVLYDQLLAMFDADPALRPRDILVMAPDIESYAPFIHAVFGYPEDPALRIPFSVADRQPRSESESIDTFLRLLELPASRCTAPELYALLQSGPFRRKFGFEERDLDQIRIWIHESGIRWGIDGAHRAELNLPAFVENTWRHGLDRLLLGYAMPGENRTLFEGILPHDDVEGTGAELLGRMASALEGLFATVEELKRPRPLGDWPTALEAVVNRFFDGDEDAEALTRLRELLGTHGEFAKIALQAGPEQLVEFEVIREHLNGLLGESAQQGSFLTGGVTFCALKPMRSIPAKVIWLLGMNDAAFPRKPQTLQFDLMVRNWKLGDRSVRDDDRYIFLEALVSARDRLCISYLGRSPLTNKELIPSVVVSELLDYVEQTAVAPDGMKVRDVIVSEHRLQAFSPHYFKPGSKLFSYSQANAAASGAQPLRGEPLFANGPVPEPEAEEREVELDSLIEFFSNPAAFFLQRRLGFRLDESDDTLPESEPMELDGLAQYGLKQELFEPLLKGTAVPDTEAFAARAFLPPGMIGVQHFEKINEAVHVFHDSILPLLGDRKRDEPFLIDLSLGEFTLSGVLDNLYAGQLVQFRAAKLKPKDWLSAWIKHLAWCAAHPALSLPPSAPPTSALVPNLPIGNALVCESPIRKPSDGSSAPAASGRTDSPPPITALAGEDQIVAFAQPLTPAPALLQSLLKLYWTGLRQPVPFFPASAMAFVEESLLPPANKRKRTPLDVARREWFGGFNMSAEKDHPAYQLCFGESDPLTPEFEELAVRVIGPMLDAVQNPS